MGNILSFQLLLPGVRLLFPGDGNRRPYGKKALPDKRKYLSESEKRQWEILFYSLCPISYFCGVGLQKHQTVRCNRRPGMPKTVESR